MIWNFLVILYRNLIRQFSYSVINVVGLATGLGCSLIIFLYVYGEWSYDRGFNNGDRIYRVGVSFFNIGTFADGPEKLLDVLPSEFAGIESATRVEKVREVPIRVKNTDFIESFVYYTDTAYFHIFNYDFVEGDQRTVLKNPNEIVLTEAMAEKYYGRIDVLGEVLEIGNKRVPYKITGIVRKPDFNTHLNAEIWFSIQSELGSEQVWASSAFHNYILLRKNFSERDLKSALDKVIEKDVFPEFGKMMGIPTLEAYHKNDNAVKFYIHRFKDIYLHSKLNSELTAGGNVNNIIIFSAVALFILILAGVNFINLTTARASRRAKEVGIRKVMGTSRGKLIVQFLMESVSISIIAMLLALAFAQIVLIIFKYITGESIISSLFPNPAYIFLFMGVGCLIGILSGIYPAFYLTAFAPIKVLKGNLSVNGGKIFRDTLVVFQFSVSIILIICTGIVVRQLNYMQNTDLGFDQRNVIVIDQAKLLGRSAEAFKNELMQANGVTKASFHSGEPGSKSIMMFQTYQTSKMQEAVTINTYSGDAEYCSLMGFHLTKGRFFKKDLASDSSGVVLNEAAVKLLDLGDDPIGAIVNKDRHVIGVVSDFHWESLKNVIGPTAILLSSSQLELGFKMSSSAAPGFLKNAERLWKQQLPQEIFHYHFLDDNFGDLVAKETMFGKVISFFTILAIFISCLGLYGLAAFTAEQRTKEIGIRKVLGASSTNIVLMLNRNFTKLILLAVVIAIPISIYCMSRWLESYAYRVSLGIWTFIGAAIGSLLIALLAVSYHSIKAALSNPAETLKYE